MGVMVPILALVHSLSWCTHEQASAHTPAPHPPQPPAPQPHHHHQSLFAGDGELHQFSFQMVYMNTYKRSQLL